MIVTENRFDVRCECSDDPHKRENGSGVLSMEGAIKQTYLKVKLTPGDAQKPRKLGESSKVSRY
jgi:hypothetical protein